MDEGVFSRQFSQEFPTNKLGMMGRKVSLDSGSFEESGILFGDGDEIFERVGDSEQEIKASKVLNLWNRSSSFEKKTNGTTPSSDNHSPLHKSASCHEPLSRSLSNGMGHWMDALKKSRSRTDPWAQYQIVEKYPTETVHRFRYNALKQKWVKDVIFVKMETESFAKGAMRKCYRMKKLSSTQSSHDWGHADNVVAKIHMDPTVLQKQYFDDVKLQMDAKVWAEEYNRKNPPKKVDIMQQACVKFVHREGQPMYHIESFIEGNYVKYNSNTGFVLHDENDEHVRATPQAFSHFTFERSGHQLIVVDVQGVGDLYTDPQIHTAHGYEYGEANLGTKGMALFFGTHQCSEICEILLLDKFDLSKEEIERINKSGSRSSTSTEIKPDMLKIKEQQNCGARKLSTMFSLVERMNSSSSDNGGLHSPPDSAMTDPSTPRQRLSSSIDSGISGDESSNFFDQHQAKASSAMPQQGQELTPSVIQKRLVDLQNFNEEQVSILGQIHMDLALYNYIGRFTEQQADLPSTRYHVEHAARAGSLDANRVLAYKHFGLHSDDFEDLQVEEDHNVGMDYLIEAATRNDKDCMVRCAKAFDTGLMLGDERKRSWTEALKWYEAANAHNGSQATQMCTNPKYEITACMAEIWRNGGYGVEKDPSYAGELYSAAGDEAMQIGKGKLANKYFMAAEECWGEVEED